MLGSTDNVAEEIWTFQPTTDTSKPLSASGAITSATRIPVAAPGSRPPRARF
jgi:hypothetical protein